LYNLFLRGFGSFNRIYLGEVRFQLSGLLFFWFFFFFFSELDFLFCFCFFKNEKKKCPLDNF